MNDFQYNSFVNGFISDTSLVSFPENSMSDVENMDVLLDGSIKKRSKLNEFLDVSGMYTPAADETTDILASEFIQTSAGITYFAFATNLNLRLVNLDNETVDHTFSLQDADTSVEATRVNILHGFTDIFVVCTLKDKVDPNGNAWKNYNFYVKGNTDGTFSSTLKPFDIAIRDFNGVDDGLKNTERPATLSDLHKYNLLNQGWGKTIKLFDSGASGLDYNHFNSEIGDYPSKSDSVILGLEPNPTADSELRFRPSSLNATYVGNTMSPLGKVIFYPLNRQKSIDALSEYITGIDGTTQNDVWDYFVENKLAFKSEIKSCTFYSNRLFFAGIEEGQDTASSILFSELLSSPDKAGRCHQEADPTSSEINDLVATDGGVIRIPGAVDIKKIESIGTNIIVFASNGVWAIKSAETGFTPNDYSLYKVADVGTNSQTASVVVESSAVFAANEGIYVIEESEVSGYLQASNILQGKIQNYYNKIPQAKKEEMVLGYDSADKKIYFLYDNKTLVLNLTTQSFFKYSFSVADDYITNIVESPFTSYDSDLEGLYTTGGDLITDTSSEPVNIRVKDGLLTSTILFFLTTDLKLLRFTDVEDSSGFVEPDFDAYFVTAPMIFGDLYRTKQVYKLITQFNRTETGTFENEDGDIEFADTSSCLASPMWDFASNGSTGKWGRQMQLYNVSNRLFVPDLSGDNELSYDIVQSRRRLRGSGRSISIKFEAEPDKKLHMIGYALVVAGRDMS